MVFKRFLVAQLVGAVFHISLFLGDDVIADCAETGALRHMHAQFPLTPNALKFSGFTLTRISLT